MTAALTMSYSVGSTMCATLQIQLDAGTDVRQVFREIRDMVFSAARSKVDSWHEQHYSVELTIVVVRPGDCSASDADLVSNAVCEALGIIPRADMLWNGKSPWKSQQ